MRSLFFTVLTLAGLSSRAQETPFNPFLGQWAGVLQYLDYQSGDTVSIKARLTVKLLPGDPSQALLFFSYPGEPGHEHTDTISYNGPSVKAGFSSLEWSTAEAGRDAGKSAILLHGYRFQKTELRLWKEVQWDHKPGFFLRNQYLLKRVKI